jgi:heme-degrading monooxygenase HmoA
MFSVLFEVHPHGDQWDRYLELARMLRPELEHISGFVDNIRYRSLTREGWILSLSSWDTEKALVRWRTRAHHHEVQEQGRARVLLDYHLRVGQLTRDTRLPAGHALTEQRLDETEVGEGTAVTLINGRRRSEDAEGHTATDLAADLGLDLQASGLLGWDVFDAVLTPGEVVLLLSWRDQAAADAFAVRDARDTSTRLRQVRVVRDYGMYDRREAPQFYPELIRP